jgi:drug/metabolite transporter (DMT)-like permease
MDRTIRESGTALARLSLAMGVVCVGFSAIFTRLAGVPGVVSAFYRAAIAAAVLAPLWIARRRSLPEKRSAAFAVAAGVSFGVDLAFWNTSLFRTSAANSTVLAYLAPVWVGLVALVIFREKLPAPFWAGMAIALAGMVIIVGYDKVVAIRIGVGDSLAIASSFFWAGYLLLAQAGRRGAGTLDFTAIAASSSAATLLIVCLARGERLGGFAPDAWAALLALGLVSHLGGYLAINFALGHMKASVASITLLGQPVITAIAAVFFLGETLGSSQIAGGTLILAGIYLVNRR